MAGMTDTDRRWLVLLRDISHAVRIPGETRIVVSLVFDMGTGVVLASAVAANEPQALSQACQTALTRPAGGLAPRRPDQVLCDPGLAETLATQLGKLKGVAPLPPIVETPTVHEAEDVFDTFVGHLAGRRSPKDFATPGDWEVMFGQALGFYGREPWKRWADDVDLLIEITIGSRHAQFAAVVLGHEGIQCGLVLYPGKTPPAGHRSRRPRSAISMPRGTLMFNLDEPQEVPEEFAKKAGRYGWPPDAELVPLFLRVDGKEPGEPGRREVRDLSVALAAIIAHDSRGPVIVEAGPQETLGTLPLADGDTASFSIRQLQGSDDPGEGDEQLRLHVAGDDLIPEGTAVAMGTVSAAGLASLRRAARIHRPLPADSPAFEGDGLPMIGILADDANGDAIAAKVAAMDPYGVTLVAAEGRAVVVLAGGEGAQVLMDIPAGDPALGRHRARMKAAKGVHVLLIGDEATSSGAGTVYGLFECHVPGDPPKLSSRNPSPRRPPPAWA
jgi:hypothetical protein